MQGSELHGVEESYDLFDVEVFLVRDCKREFLDLADGFIAVFE